MDFVGGKAFTWLTGNLSEDGWLDVGSKSYVSRQHVSRLSGVDVNNLVSIVCTTR